MLEFDTFDKGHGLVHAPEYATVLTKRGWPTSR
jgi:hypothetical protein